MNSLPKRGCSTTVLPTKAFQQNTSKNKRISENGKKALMAMKAYRINKHTLVTQLACIMIQSQVRLPK